MKPILQIRHNRFIYLAITPLPLALAGLFFYAFFSSDMASEFGDDLAPKIAASFFILIGIFLSTHFFMRFLKNTPVFSIYEEGFEANTNGVSSGLIKWEDIKKAEEQIVKQGPGKSAALAIYFKQPDRYDQQQPLAVRMLRSAVKASGAHHLQRLSSTTEDDVPYLIPISTLGDQYPQVKKIIESKIAQEIKR
jgi:hypothetical protein